MGREEVRLAKRKFVVLLNQNMLEASFQGTAAAKGAALVAHLPICSSPMRATYAAVAFRNVRLFRNI